MSSLKLRAPAPSDTIAARSVSAAASISSSPPTDRPIPPIRSGSTSGRRWRYAIAALISARRPSPTRWARRAATLAAAVEQQHAVPVAGEHARLRLRAVPTGEGDHGRAVLGRHIPALELEPVLGRELTSSCATPRRSGGTTAAHVRGDVAEPERHDDRAATSAATPISAPRVAPPEAALGPPRPPQRGGAHDDQQRAGGQAQQPGEVVAGGPTSARSSPRTRRRAEHAGHQGKRGGGRRAGADTPMRQGRSGRAGRGR